jgi:hypothetical protein
VFPSAQEQGLGLAVYVFLMPRQLVPSVLPIIKTLLSKAMHQTWTKHKTMGSITRNDVVLGLPM